MNKEFISAKRFTKKIIIEFILWSIIVSYLISFVLVSVDIITNHFLTYNDEINLLNILNPFLHFVLGKSLAIIITIKTLTKNYQIFSKRFKSIYKEYFNIFNHSSRFKYNLYTYLL